MTDEEILNVSAVFSYILTGGCPTMMCYLVASPLKQLLNRLGVDTRLVRGEVRTSKAVWEHFWLQLEDGRIVDPTAGQFTELGLGPVYLGELPEAYYEPG